ncbi:unnamed protein product [Caenorhabditis bovis]|uniref:Uncharacterized protein n=1 Tax=Caenorhabditis bovis TaxID=2654633 RepID=A0A8S1ELP7_9PELO|nr:unnamed protein product [Caenorhabditis bovis]
MTSTTCMDNLIDLEDPYESSITQILHERFKNRLNYTKASDVLVFCNNFLQPEKTGNEKTDEHIPSEKKISITGLAETALSKINDQSAAIVFGGESGSGKSFNVFEAFKFFVSQRNSKLSLKQMEAIQTVLRSFGCAKTLKNNEATKYGCSFDLLYQKNQLSGLNLKYTVPLEVSRVISQKPGERNFNIFYEIYHGLNDEAKSSFGIKELQKFFYMNQGISADNIQADEDHFDDVDNALALLGFSEDHRLNIYRIVSCILHIGNIYFKTRRSLKSEIETVELGNSSEVKWIAFLLEIDYELLVEALLQRKPNSPNISMDTALDNRDGLAMLLYEELFKWILTRINVHFKCPTHTAVISILDQYGFEKYNNNGLEEFLINSVNERIENLFVKHVFHDQLVDYLKDGINIDYKVPSNIENGKVVELLYKKPYGLLPLLTDECKFPKGSIESYLEHCNLNHLDKSSYGKARNKERLEFAVRHCIGSTWYSVNDFFRKNRRNVPGTLVKQLSESRNAVISLLFRSLEIRDGADYFASQVQLVIKGVQDIVEKINSSKTYFVRCIRSNNERTPMKFDIPMINRQVKNLLLPELLKFRNIGFPVKMTKTQFAQKYRCLLPGDIAMCQNEKEIIQDILQGQGVKYQADFRIGNNNVFLREKLADRYELQQFNISRDAAIMIQKHLRAFIESRKFARKKKAIIKLQAGLRGWRARRDYIIQREEMFKELGRTTKRNKRLAAYHQVLEGGLLPDTNSTLVGYIDIDENARKLLNRPKSDSEYDITHVVTNYLSIPTKQYLPHMKSMTLTEFADENFKGHLLEPRREPIMTPFLHKESDLDFRLSVEIFKLVLKYMNDRKLTKSQRNDLGRYIVQQGITNPCQRDEIIIQVLNQINKNSDKVAVELGWKLIHMAISVYPPTENIIPLLIGVFNDQPNPLKEQLFSTLQRRLKIYDSEISRELPPSNLELLTTPAAHNTVAEVRCYDGIEYDVHLNPWITANEIAERILKQREVGTALGWSVEVETPSRVFAPAGTQFIHDVFAEVDGVESDDNKSKFFNFPPEKLVKPIKTDEKPKTPEITEEIVMETARESTPKSARDYPPPEEWIRSKSRNTPERFASPKVVPEQRATDTPASSDESLEREYNEHAEYSYTLPKTLRREKKSPSANQKRDHSFELDNAQNCVTSPVLPRKTYSRSENEDYKPINFAPPPTFNYHAQMPMMQYVPVMMTTQPMMGGQPMAMMTQPVMMQPHFSYTPQYPQVPQYSAPEPNLEMMSPQSVRSYGVPYSRNDGYEEDHNYGRQPEPYQQDNHNHYRNRFRKGEVPSQYSTIRNMPVPENAEHVDQFLDAVFDQVLSKDEHRNAEIDARQIAGTIKGGRNGPAVAAYPNATLRRNESPMRHRAQSLPRYMSPTYDLYDRRQPLSPDFSSDQSTSSDDHMAAQRGRSWDRQGYRQESLNHYDNQRPVYMMPVQMNENGEMVILSPIPGEYETQSRTMSRGRDSKTLYYNIRQPRGVEKYMARRSPSVDGYTMKPPLIRRTPDGVERIAMPQLYAPQQTPNGRRNRQDNIRTLSRSDSKSRERIEAPMMTRQIPPRIEQHYPHQNGTRLRSPSADERRVNGLNRIPVEAYTEPAVKSTVNNGEQFNPHRFNVREERAIAMAEKEKSKEALEKLNVMLKRLPPPVDNVRIVRNTNHLAVQRPISPPTPEPVVIHQPPPPPLQPQPVQQFQEKWVIRDMVERDPATQERVRGTTIKDALTPLIKRKTAEKPAVKYVKPPWKLTIRKEMFYPGETVNDIQVIDQVFAQIVEDCKKSYPYRIRLQDRQQVEEILRANHVPPSDLQQQTNIHPDIKMKVIDTARLWPLYFNQIYEVIELRPDESVGLLLSISEHGIRLLLHTPHNIENPLTIHDHFPFETIVDVSLEANDILTIHTKPENDVHSHYTLRLKTRQAAQIKSTLEKCISGGAVPKRQLARALEDYVTNEPNHLSFNKGDLIEILAAPDGEIPPVGDWLYGKIGNRFGYLLRQYIESNSNETIPPLRFDSNFDRDENVQLFEDEVPFSSERYTMLDFATKYFREPKERKRNEDWTWGDIAQSIKFSSRPITQSLLKDLSAEDNKHAVEIFSCIMRFMGDEQLKKSESITDVVFKILLICHKHPLLRDEVYCQLIKQTTSNTSLHADSVLRGWRLLLIVTSYFPSSLTLKPYLLQYLSENAEDLQRPNHGIAKMCLTNILQTFKYGGRKVLLNALEVQNVTDGHLIRKQKFFITKENSVALNLRPITVAEEVIQELCLMLNVRSLPEQQEFSLCYSSGKEKRLQYCKNDDYILDIITDMEHKKLPYQFFFRRTVWVHPLRFDNTAYIDSIFDHVIDDYLRGSMVSTNAHSQLTAATTEEIIRLGALLFRLLPDQSKGVTTKNLPFLVPKTFIDPKHRIQEETVARITREVRLMDPRMPVLDIKAQFLSLLSTWPLFGVSHYKLKSAVEEGNRIPEVVLSIGKTGVHLLQPKSQEIYKEFRYDQILSVESVKKSNFKFVRLVSGHIGKEKTLEFKTDDADEIAHLIGQYIYVVNEQRSSRTSTEL